MGRRTTPPPDPSMSLEQLEGEAWGEPTYGSYVVRTSHALRRKPLRDLAVEELRLAIAQSPFIPSLPRLVPLALERLAADPLIGGHHFDGDLLLALLRVPPEFWTRHADQRGDLEGIVDRFLAAVERHDEGWREACLPSIQAAIAAFRAGRGARRPGMEPANPGGS